MDILEKEFEEKALIRGGVYLLAAIDAIELIKRCKEMNKEILGIDSFIITNEKTQPVLEDSIDYSTGASKEHNYEDIWDRACNFVNNRAPKGYMFEIVYD